MTEKMGAAEKVNQQHHMELIKEIRAKWDIQEGENKGDGKLQFDSFFHGFMSPYFGCYRYGRTKKGLLAMDMNEDGFVDWNEFQVFIKWALCQYMQC